MVKITKKPVKIGGSYGFILDKKTFEYMNIDLTKDMIEVDVKKIPQPKQIKSYKCVYCTHYFDSDEDEPYCPICERVDTLEKKYG